MQQLTYKQAYDKIIEAYFKDQIQPYEPKFCFCGTLSGGSNWERGMYNGRELRLMEASLLKTLRAETLGFIGEPVMVEEASPELGCGHLAYYEPRQTNGSIEEIIEHPNYETALFNGMVAALGTLKEIHRSRGEDVDGDIPVFSKRNLKQSSFS